MTPWRPLSKYNAETDRRHVRRELTPGTSAFLLPFVETHTTAAHNMPGTDRAMLYRLALGTGLRAGGLRSLTPASFDLDSDPPTVTVAAAYSKRRRTDVQPMRRDMAERLRPWLASRPADARLFGRLPGQHGPDAPQGPWRRPGKRGWPMKRCRLRNATRGRSDFLLYKNAAGEVADFHATRHTFISGIVASGASIKGGPRVGGTARPC